ncbi:endothelin-converting enzyme homolog, partial [Trichonephila inaurata madagascariensis]
MDFPKQMEIEKRNSPAAGRNYPGRGQRDAEEKDLLAAHFNRLFVLIFAYCFEIECTRVYCKNYCTTPACVMTAATILNSLDQTVDPCEDFYQYACGGWIKSHSLSEDAVMFSKMTKRLADNLHIFKYVLEDESFELKGEAEKNARILYRSCMNTTRIEERGARPLLDLFKKIGGWNISGDFNINDWDFQKALDLINNNNLASSFFAWVIMADLKNSSQNSLVVQQTELTLDSRDYYLNKTMDDKVISALLEYMTKTGVLLGGEEHATRLQMQDVIDFEMKLAEIMLSAEELADHNLTYRKLTINQLQMVSPFINWRHHFHSAFKMVDREIHSSEPVIVFGLDYLKKLSELVTAYLSNAKGRVTVANYLAWKLVHSSLDHFSKPFREAGHDLKVAIFGGDTEDIRWGTCVKDVHESMGFALSAMFVRKYFSGE